MLLATRAWFPVGDSPPAWITTSPLIEAEWETPYTQTLLATGASAYAIASGSLPPGLTLAGDTITGRPTPDPGAPVWSTAAGSLGSGAQGGGFSASLAAPGAASFVVHSGLLPWGITLDPVTGALAGTLAITGGAEDSPGPAPVWTTPAGSLGAVNEQAAVSLSVAATSAVSYDITSGGLPWGLSINRDTGAITGTAAEVGGGVTPEPSNPITWTAPASANLGSFAVGASVSIAQTVTPVAGAFSVVSGVMPWGLTMSRGTGLISGTIGAANALGVYTFAVICAALADSSAGSRTYTITIV